MKPKIVFAPGCFDKFEGTQEELDELVEEINRFINSDEFLDAVENAIPLEDFEEFFDEELPVKQTLH